VGTGLDKRVPRCASRTPIRDRPDAVTQETPTWIGGADGEVWPRLYSLSRPRRWTTNVWGALPILKPTGPRGACARERAWVSLREGDAAERCASDTGEVYRSHHESGTILPDAPTTKLTRPAATSATTGFHEDVGDPIASLDHTWYFASSDFERAPTREDIGLLLHGHREIAFLPLGW